MTVLITAIAATITMLTIRLLLVTLQENSIKVQYQSNRISVKNVEKNLINIIENNPTSPFEFVLPTEAPRRCIVDNSVYNPGAPWPSYCGFYWRYETSSNEIITHIYYGKLKDINAPEGGLTIYIQNSKGGASVGEILYLSPGGKSRVMLYSGGNFNPSNLGTVSSSGTIYTGGTYTVGGNSGVSNSLVIAKSYLGSKDNNNIYSEVDGELSYHNFISSNLDTGDLRNMSTTLYNFACPSLLTNSPVNIKVQNRDYSSTLCFSPGYTNITSGDTLYTIPTSVTSILVVPAPDHKLYLYGNSLEEYDMSSSPVDLGSSCSSDCKGDSINYITAQSHPGSLNFWTPLGVYNYPTSGLVGSSTTTHFGLCDGNYDGVNMTGFISSSGVCRKWDGITEGAKVDSNFLLVAGNPTSPVDVFISGPVITSNGETAGVLSSGDIYFPYWSHPTGGSYNFNVKLSLVAIGRSIGNPFRSYPTNIAINSDNLSGNLYLSGLLGSSQLSLADVSPLFSSTIFSNSGILHNNNPSLLSFPDIFMKREYMKKLTKDELDIEYGN